MFGRQPSILGHFFLWARDSNERQFTGCMISHTMTKNWDKTTIWLSSAENATSAWNSCSMSLCPHWHWFTSLLGMHGLYRFLIVNSILLDSGRGVMTGHAREGVDGLAGLTGLVSRITKAIDMFSFFFLVDSHCNVWVHWMIVIEIYKESVQLLSSCND